MTRAEVAELLREQATHMSEQASALERDNAVHKTARANGELVDVSKGDAADFRRRAEHLNRVAEGHERDDA
jgi:hypothetical protein